MGLEDLKAKILSYLEEVQVANRNDIADYTGASGRTLTKALNELVEDGSLEIIGERPLTYKFVKKNIIKIELPNFIKIYLMEAPHNIHYKIGIEKIPRQKKKYRNQNISDKRLKV